MDKLRIVPRTRRDGDQRYQGLREGGGHQERVHVDLKFEKERLGITRSERCGREGAEVRHREENWSERERSRYIGVNRKGKRAEGDTEQNLERI